MALAVLVAAPAVAGPDLRPIAGAQLQLPTAAVAATVDVEGARRLAGLVDGGGGGWPARADAGAEAELLLSLPDGAEKAPWLVVCDLDAPKSARGRLELEASRKAGRTPEPVEAVTVEGLPGGTARLVAPRGTRAIRLILTPADGAFLRLERIRLVRLDPRGRKNDYWLFLGASLTVGGIGDGVAFGEALAAAYPGFRPYVANEAVSGWTSTKLRRELPDILARHPHARYVAIHIGGNDVSIQRPFPGGAEKLQSNIAAILEQITAAGKVPILSRLSYRAYKEKKGKPAVPPEENGSGPYVQEIYDPLIARYCGPFFDRRARRGVVDLYGYYKAHQDEIGGDGVHLKRSGYASWRRLWTETAGAVVYGAR
jgi:lysophospholipase L1-like esterase